MNVAVVGGTGGIGRALSRFMASRGANVWVVGQTFRDSDIAGIEFIEADLSLMREARRVGSRLPVEKLDLVIFTTGIFAAPQRQGVAIMHSAPLTEGHVTAFIAASEALASRGLA